MIQLDVVQQVTLLFETPYGLFVNKLKRSEHGFWRKTSFPNNNNLTTNMRQSFWYVLPCFVHELKKGGPMDKVHPMSSSSS